MKIKKSTETYAFINKVKIGTKNRFEHKLKDDIYQQNVMDIIKHMAFDPYMTIPVEERCKKCKKFDDEHIESCN